MYERLEIDVLRIMIKEGERLSRLRKVETPRSFQHGHPQLLFHNLPARVIGELQVVDASHDAWKVVVSSQRWFVRLPDNACDVPPIGSLGLPVMN